MRRIAGSLLGVGLCLLLGCSSTTTQGSSDKPKPIETFTCIAAAMGSGATGVITVTISRWSTDEEREALRSALIEFGQDKALAVMNDIRPPVGFLRTPNTMGYDLYFARNTVLPDGSRHVVVATNRRVSFAAAATGATSLDYQVNVIELHLDKNGKGEGKMVPAAKVTWNAELKKIEIENYQAMPVDLINVTSKAGY